MAETNGSDATESKRKELTKAQKHLELLAKNVLLKDELEEKIKKVKSTIKLCVEDLKTGSYVVDSQGKLELGDDDEPDARS